MREQRKILEHHADMASLGLDVLTVVGDHVAVDGIRPAVGRSRPAIRRKTEDLPEPDAPSRHRIEPVRDSNETSSRAFQHRSRASVLETRAARRALCTLCPDCNAIDSPNRPKRCCSSPFSCQKRVVNANRTARGEPGVMFVLLCALR